MIREALVSVLLLSLLLAGCVEPPPTNVPPTELRGRPSALAGRVLDDEARPVSGANVSADATTWTQSDEEGDYELAGLRPGTHVVTVVHLRFQPATFEVRLGEGEVARHDVRLVAAPLPQAYKLTYQYHGTYDCAWEFVILVGDCMVIVSNVTGAPDPVTNETYFFPLQVDPGWSKIHAELTWQAASHNQLEGMRFHFEHGNSSQTGHGIKVARVVGPEAPLIIDLERGTPHPTADVYPETTTPAMIGPNGETLQIRVFPRGRLNEYGGQVCYNGDCMFGAGIGVGLEFDILANVTYAPPPR